MKEYVLELLIIFLTKFQSQFPCLPPLLLLLQDLMIFRIQMYLIRWEMSHMRWEMIKHLWILHPILHHLHIILLLLQLQLLLLLLSLNLSKEDLTGSRPILLTGRTTGTNQTTYLLQRDRECKNQNQNTESLLQWFQTLTLNLTLIPTLTLNSQHPSLIQNQ